MRRACGAVLTLLGLCCVLAAPTLPAGQNPETLPPEQSAAKAKQLIQQLIEGLGGKAFLGVRESECEGRLAQFGHSGDLTGYIDFRDYWRYPDKNRTDYAKKGVIVDLYAGDQGWTMDKGGVSELPASAVKDFQEQVKADLGNLLRVRLNEEGMVFRYGGSDIVDLKQVDWVEIVDRERRTFRIAIDRREHLPIRMVVITRNDMTRERTEEVTIYSNYQEQNGVETPLQVTRSRDGRRVYQAFYTGCKYNPGFPDELFTRAALEKRFSEVGKKGKKN
jgi:hypothetical protein